MLRSTGVTGKLIDASATQLVSLIATRAVSSVEVVEAHIERLEAIASSIGGMSVTRYEEARKEAELADQQIRRDDPSKPLLGLPVTIKDAFSLAGTPSAIGLTHRAAQAQVADEDAPLVQRLRDAGAIVLGKTNVPQLMFSHECRNPLHGRTNNPWDPTRTPGGSSGGEAAVIAAGGSPLGIGSDLGGSIRVPSHFCGIAGLKPTSGRLTKRGNFLTLRGLTTISFQPGPMARRVDDLYLAMRVLTRLPSGEMDYDAAPSEIADFRKIKIRDLRVGVFGEHPFFPVAPPVKDTVDRAARILAQAGADVVPYVPSDFEAAIGCYLSIMSADGGADLRRILRGSEVAPGIGKTLFLSGLPQAVRQPLALLLGRIGQHGWAYALRHSGPRSANIAWQLAHFRRTYTERILREIRDLSLDAILMPPHALPALRHGQASDLILAGCYAFWANLLEMPAATVPVRVIMHDEALSNRVPRRDVVQLAAQKTEEDSVGLPLGVQVVAPHWREDTVLAVSAAIEAACSFRESPEELPSTLQRR